MNAMDSIDTFFTQTVVGPPLTVWMGRRHHTGTSGKEGLNVNFRTGESRLSQMWADWAILSHVWDPVGQPRRRPKRLRRVLERHALVLALLGLASLVVALMLIGVTVWT
jgi:hypothetical protein